MLGGFKKVLSCYWFNAQVRLGVMVFLPRLRGAPFVFVPLFFFVDVTFRVFFLGALCVSKFFLTSITGCSVSIVKCLSVV